MRIIEESTKRIQDELALLQLREKYNHIKHRGMYYFGVGNNPSCVFEKYGIEVSHYDTNGETMACSPRNLLFRDSINLDELQEQLTRFFESYSNAIEMILALIPEKYTRNSINGLTEMLKCFKIDDE